MTPFPTTFPVNVTRHAALRMVERFGAKKADATTMVEVLVESGNLLTARDMQRMFKHVTLTKCCTTVAWNALLPTAIFVVKFDASRCHVVTTLEVRVREGVSA